MSETTDTSSTEDPKTKPEVTTIPPKETPKEKTTETTVPEDSIVVPKAEFAKMQKTMLDLQKESDDATKAKVKAERDAVYNELLILNPKLAKIHTEASKEVLEGALSAAKEIKTGFQSLKTKPEDTPKADAGNHDGMKYDFIASQKEGKPVWVYS